MRFSTLIATIVYVCTVLTSLSALAQDLTAYTRLGLPDGATMRLGKGPIRELRYSPDGTRLAVASGIGIWLYDTTNYQEIALLAESGSVSSVAFSPDGSALASGGWGDRTVHLWDARTGAHLRTVTPLDGHTYWGEVHSVAFSPDGSMLASGGSGDGAIHLWDMDTGAFMHTLEGHTDSVNSVAFSPDGNTLASGGGWRDNTIRLWDARGATLLRTVTPLEENMEENTGWADHVAFSPDGGTLVSSGDSHTILRLWDVRTGALLRTVTPLEGNTGWVHSVAFSPDGSTLASGNWDYGVISVRLWDARTGALLRTLEGHMRYIDSVAFSPDGSTLASGSYGGAIHLWDARTGARLRTLEGHTGGVNSVAFSPDGSTLATANWSYFVHLWDARTGALLRTVTPLDGSGHGHEVHSVAFSPDGSTLASGSRDVATGDGNIRLWDARTGALLRTLEGHTDSVESVAFSPDGGTLASGSRDSTVRLLNARTGAYLHTLEGHEHEVHSVAFSPDGSTLASGSRDVATGDGSIRLWDARSGVRLRTLESGQVRSLAFSPDGSTLASGSRDGTRGDDTVRLWDARTGAHLRILVEHTEGILSVAFSPDGRTLAGGSYEAVRLWDARTGALRRTLEGHNGWVYSVAFSPDGSTLACGSSRGTVLLWDIPPALNTTGIVSLSLASVPSPAVGARIMLNITDGENVAGYQATLTFDPSALSYLESADGGYFPGGVFAVPAGVTANQITLAATSLAGESQGDGTLATATFEVIAIKQSTLHISDVVLSDSAGAAVTPRLENAEITVSPQIVGDVTQDGIVNIQDLMLVAGHFGQAGENIADVNGDGIVNIQDLVLVAAALGNAAAPPARDPETALTREVVKAWLAAARRLTLTDATSRRGVLFLENLLAGFTPKNTALLPNYPNPFNPETWIPYRLAEDADVRITIYDTAGGVVRQLNLGRQPAGFYTDQSRAAYWDGKNQNAEPVASGAYVCQLRAGGTLHIRRLAIIK